MYQGGETALQADCGEFDSRRLHKVNKGVKNEPLELSYSRKG